MNSSAEYSDEQKSLLLLLSNHNEKVFLLVAPSFVVDFDYLSFVPLMKGLGFDKVSELTFGAKIINQNYHAFIKKNKLKQKKFISSVCPASVQLVRTKHPELVKFLMSFDSPVIAMTKIIRKHYPEYKIVFLAPCFAKKAECADSQIVDVALTFGELKQILANEKSKKKNVSHLFDRFYNDYTKVYPLSGGLSATLHSKDILKKNEVVACDGCVDLMRLFDKHSDKVFYDILFCKGGCIGGNGVAPKLSLVERKKRVLKYREFSNREDIPENRKGLNKYTARINFEKKFA